MKFVNFIERVKKVGKDEGVWITNKSFNQLIKECNVRINNEGHLELEYKDTKAQVLFESVLLSDSEKAYVKVKEVSTFDSYTHLKKDEIYVMPSKPKTATTL